MISGALYHLEATWGVKLLFFFPFLFYLKFSFITFFIFWSSILAPRFFLYIASLILFVWPLDLPIMLYGCDLDIPKSPILTSQFLLMKIFAGFMSLWMTFDLWRNCNAQRRLYVIVLICSPVSLILLPHWINCFKSVSKYSITRNRIGFFVWLSTDLIT